MTDLTLRRELVRSTHDTATPATQADLQRSLFALADLGDEDVIARAWS